MHKTGGYKNETIKRFVRGILDAHKIPATDVILDYNENSKKFYVRNENSVNYENIDLSTLETSTVNELYEVLIGNNVKFRFSGAVLKKYFLQTLSWAEQL